MDFDAKWYFIAIAVIFGFGMVASAYSAHEKAKCRITAIEAKMPVDQIEKVCS